MFTVQFLMDAVPPLPPMVIPLATMDNVSSFSVTVMVIQYTFNRAIQTNVPIGAVRSLVLKSTMSTKMRAKIFTMLAVLWSQLTFTKV